MTVADSPRDLKTLYNVFRHSNMERLRKQERAELICLAPATSLWKNGTCDRVDSALGLHQPPAWTQVDPAAYGTTLHINMYQFT